MSIVATKDYETGTSGAVTVVVGKQTYNSTVGKEGLATEFNIGLVVTNDGTSPTGTVGVQVTTIGGTIETLTDKYGDAVTFDVSAIKSIRVSGVPAKSFTFTPANFAHVVSYVPTVTGW